MTGGAAPPGLANLEVEIMGLHSLQDMVFEHIVPSFMLRKYRKSPSKTNGKMDRASRETRAVVALLVRENGGKIAAAARKVGLKRSTVAGWSEVIRAKKDAAIEKEIRGKRMKG
jgi:hypothetical protein